MKKNWKKIAMKWSNLDKWLKDLQKDKDALVDLYNNAQAVSIERDAKFHELKTLIKNKKQHTINDGNNKVLVFTAFADTAQYLYDNLKEYCQKELSLNSALVCGSKTETTFGKNDYDSILTNFSPVAKNRGKMNSMPQAGEIDVLIATDCISEGQNLQDCDYLVNYDIHWNPVRIIQRFGRIDRLGSINSKIQLVNFWPTKDLDNYINLKERVEARMALVDITATGEDNILNTEQLEELISEDLKYRNRQLLRMRDEVLDLEDTEESASLTDFTLDDFRVDLTNYLEGNRKRLEESPLGLYAVVPSPLSAKEFQTDLFTVNITEIIKPGVIYCLKQKGDTGGTESVNPLQPYFLVYVRNDGTVRYNYTHAKQILEVYRLLCQGRTVPYEKLCDWFNESTDNGRDMVHYSTLLKKAINEIVQIFKKRSNQQLTSTRSALLLPKKQQVQDMEHFELVTWLIIQ
jgi:hypothetical protein